MQNEAHSVVRLGILLLLNERNGRFAAQHKLLKHRASRSGFRARKCSRIKRKRAWRWGVGSREAGKWELGERGDARACWWACWVGGGGRACGYADTYLARLADWGLLLVWAGKLEGWGMGVRRRLRDWLTNVGGRGKSGLE